MSTYTGYLFTHFTGEHKDGEQVYLSLSRDGLHWNDLNGGEVVLRTEVGEKGARDPFILRNQVTGKYNIIASDLRIEAGKGWDIAQYAGSRCLLVWESDNLVDWNGPELHEVGIPTAGCVWAPEAIYDEEKKEYMVFWASMVLEEGDAEPKQRIYAARTTDFHRFTPAEKYQEGTNHIIDTTMIKVGEYYYRFSKDETVKNIRLEKSKSLDKGSFEPINCPVLDTLMGVEGPEVFKFNDRDEWCLIVDCFAADTGYLPLVTSDIGSGELRILDKGEYDFGVNKKRHGGILPITEEEYQAVAAKWMK